jgi:hypothetical protein
MQARLDLVSQANFDIGLSAWLDVWIVPSHADSKSKDHGEEIVDVEGPFVRKQITVL